MTDEEINRELDQACHGSKLMLVWLLLTFIALIDLACIFGLRA